MQSIFQVQKRNNRFLFQLGTIAITLNEIFQPVIQPEEKKKKEKEEGEKRSLLAQKSKEAYY